MLRIISMALMLLLCVFLASGEKYLTEKPDFLQPCSVTASSFTNCLASNIENILKEWKDGIPELPTVTAIDPLEIQRIVVDGDPLSPIGIHLELENVVVEGISDAQLTEASYKAKPLSIQSTFVVPKIVISGDYNITGHLLEYPLDGTGKASLTIEQILVDMNKRFLVREERNVIFTDIERLHLNVRDINGLHLRLDNKAAESKANEILNQNEPGIFEILRPSLNGAFGRIIKDHLSKIFAYVPANYIFEGIPVASRRY
ncbi:protein takeout-like [Musca autumnalis]|uniref:protein takeout-like n=1 Tax=Musca autumnalis TaxID=221902 RepID=UPI003CE8DF70